MSYEPELIITPPPYVVPGYRGLVTQRRRARTRISPAFTAASIPTYTGTNIASAAISGGPPLQVPVGGIVVFYLYTYTSVSGTAAGVQLILTALTPAKNQSSVPVFQPVLIPETPINIPLLSSPSADGVISQAVKWQASSRYIGIGLQATTAWTGGTLYVVALTEE